jgi:hypothetical protein
LYKSSGFLNFLFISLSTHQEEEEERRRRNVQRHTHDGEKQRETPLSSGAARTRAFCF